MAGRLVYREFTSDFQIPGADLSGDPGGWHQRVMWSEHLVVILMIRDGRSRPPDNHLPREPDAQTEPDLTENVGNLEERGG